MLGLHGLSWRRLYHNLLIATTLSIKLTTSSSKRLERSKEIVVLLLHLLLKAVHVTHLRHPLFWFGPRHFVPQATHFVFQHGLSDSIPFHPFDLDHVAVHKRIRFMGAHYPGRALEKLFVNRISGRTIESTGWYFVVRVNNGLGH